MEVPSTRAVRDLFSVSFQLLWFWFGSSAVGGGADSFVRETGTVMGTMEARDV